MLKFPVIIQKIPTLGQPLFKASIPILFDMSAYGENISESLNELRKKTLARVLFTNFRFEIIFQDAEKSNKTLAQELLQKGGRKK